MRALIAHIRQVRILLKPRIWSFRNPILLKRKKGRSFRIFLMGFVGLLIWGGIFAVSYRVLVYFKGIQELGDLLAFKLLSMALITIFSLLVFSSIITCLAKLYLSKDLHLVHSLPVPGYTIFFARWIESTVDSSWMVVVYTLPVFISYGIVYRTGLTFYAMILLNLSTLSLIASGISAFLVMLAVILIPANRLRSIFIFLGFTLFLILYIAFRLLRPERLVDPEIFSTALIYLKALRTPSSPFLPSTWAFDSLKASLAGNISTGGFHLAVSTSFAFFIGFAGILFADSAYFRGVSKAQTAPMRVFKSNDTALHSYGLLPGPTRAFVVKEVKSFLRDQTQWSQIFLVAALFFIYIYNFKVLPLEKAPIKTLYLQNLLSFLNMGLAGFVLAAITARFAYPAVSSEGEAFWIVKSAPVCLRTFLWIKFFIYFLPLLLLSECVIVTTNLFLHVTPFMMMLSTVTIFFIVPGVVAIGIGMGAAYPDFKSENPAQSVTGFGGLCFMMLSAGFISFVIILEARPVYNLFMAGIQHRAITPFEWVWTAGSFIFVFIICILAIVLPMRFGEKRLLERHQ